MGGLRFLLFSLQIKDCGRAWKRTEFRYLWDRSDGHWMWSVFERKTTGNFANWSIYFALFHLFCSIATTLMWKYLSFSFSSIVVILFLEYLHLKNAIKHHNYLLTADCTLYFTYIFLLCKKNLLNPFVIFSIPILISVVIRISYDHRTHHVGAFQCIGFIVGEQSRFCIRQLWNVLYRSSARLLALTRFLLSFSSFLLFFLFTILHILHMMCELSKTIDNILLIQHILNYSSKRWKII